MTYPEILRRHRTQAAGIVVRLYVSESIPTVRGLPGGGFAPAEFRTHLHVGTRYMRAA